MRVIGIAGKKGSGKTTVAAWLEGFFEPHGQARAFADPMKAALMQIGLTADQMHDAVKKEDDISWLPEGTTPRMLMQTLGTEWGRKLICDDMWLRVMQRKLEENEGSEGEYGPQPVYIIHDVRFENEANWIRRQEFSLMIFVNRDSTFPSVDTHPSEQGIVLERGDYYVLNNFPDKMQLAVQLRRQFGRTKLFARMGLVP